MMDAKEHTNFKNDQTNSNKNLKNCEKEEELNYNGKIKNNTNNPDNKDNSENFIKENNHLEEKESLTKFFLSDIDFKIYLFLDSRSLLNLMLSSKIIYDVFQNRFLQNYFRSIFPNKSNIDLIIKLWLLVLNNNNIINSRNRNSNDKRKSVMSLLRSNTHRDTIKTVPNASINTSIFTENINLNSNNKDSKSKNYNNAHKTETSLFVKKANSFENDNICLKHNSSEKFENNSTLNNNPLNNANMTSTTSNFNISNSIVNKNMINNDKINYNFANNIKIEENSDFELEKQVSKSVFDSISRDIHRTFHFGRFTNSNGRNQLRMILENVAINNPDIGYCQGMNFIAGALLEITDSIETSTLIFQRILDNYDLYYLFIEQMPDYSIRVYQINYFIKLHLPDLYYYFKHNDLTFDLIYQKWIMTLFSNYLPISKLTILFHFFLIDKWEALIKYSFILIKHRKDSLMKIDLEGLCNFTKDTDWLNELSDLSFFNMYLSVNEDMSYTNIITNELLADLKEQFYIDLISNKLNSHQENSDIFSSKKDKWQPDQIKEIEKYQIKSVKIKNAVKDQVELLKTKIEKISKIYTHNLVEYQLALSKFYIIKKKLTDLIDEKEGLNYVADNLEIKIKSKETSDMLNTLKTGNSNEDYAFPKKKSRIGSFFNYFKLPILTKSSETNTNSNNLNRHSYNNENNTLSNNNSVTTSSKTSSFYNQEAIKFRKMSINIDEEILHLNMKVNEEFLSIDKLKMKVEKLEKERKNVENILRKFLEMSSIKERDLLKELSINLRKCQSFKKNFEI